MIVIATLLGVGGVAGVAAANLISHRMIEQVNAKSPPHTQINRLYLTPWGVFDMIGRHKQLYPGSPLPHALWPCSIGGVIAFVVGVVQLA
jgi:hypothetical protein